MCTYVCVCVRVCVCACMHACAYVHARVLCVCVYICVYCISNTTGGKNLKKFKEWLESDAITDIKIVEQTWDLLAYLAYDTLQQVCNIYPTSSTAEHFSPVQLILN